MATDDYKARVAQYNAELKAVRTHQEFLGLYGRASDESLGLFGKRGGHEAMNFRQVRREYDKHPDWDRVDYLYDDGVSTGEGYVRRLYQHLRFR